MQFRPSELQIVGRLLEDIRMLGASAGGAVLIAATCLTVLLTPCRPLATSLFTTATSFCSLLLSVCSTSSRSTAESCAAAGAPPRPATAEFEIEREPRREKACPDL